MGKQGPCYHCGVTSTPLWRNGPPEKPVLCNACGSRWRTKGTLSNYTPLHSRADADEYEDQRVSKVKSISFKVGGEKLKKRKLSYEKTTDEDTCNRSSSGSALSNSDSSNQFKSADASDFTGPSRSAVWENQVPSKKRTLITRTKSSSSSSPVEKLIKDLRAILHEQKSSYLSLYSEEDLLFESDAPMVSVEIGHGSVLIKHPSWLVREEDSEASSVSFENKPCASNEAYSHPAKVMQQEPDRMQHFLTQDSSLCYIDLNDVVNFEVLMGHFTSEERRQLLKHLLPDDTSELPVSLKDMFDSSCFKESLSIFQQLVSDGVFSNGYSGPKAKDLKTLKKLVMSESTISEWLELYSKLKDSREIEDESESKLGLTKDQQCAKKPLQEQNLNMPSKETTQGPERGLTKLVLGSLFRLPTDSDDECSDQDLLLDVPSYGSFPEAELLLPPSSITIPSNQC